MGVRPPAQLRLLLGGLAASGVVAAHVTAYYLTEPDPYARADLLAATGHGGWTLVVAIALGILVAGLVQYATRRAWSLGAPTGVPTLTGGSLFAVAATRLIPLQVLGCVGLEAIERWMAGEAVATVLTEPAVLIGICLQLLGALVGALILVLFTRAIDLIFGRSLPLPFTARQSCPRPISRVLPARFRVAAGFGTLRGPPLVN